MPRFATCFIFICLFLHVNSSGQRVAGPAEWKKMDSAIRIKKNLGDLQAQILNLKIRAINEQDDAALARCYAALLRIKDQKTEDSLFFRNAAFMDSMISNHSTSLLLKSIMHLLLARRIAEFENRFYFQRNKNLIKTGIPGKEYSVMDKKELDSLVALHIDSSIQISKQVARTDLDELLWLSSDPLVFLFRPDYTDLLYGERIFMSRNNLSLHSEKKGSEWLSESQDAFIEDGDQAKTFTNDERILFRHFQEWIRYHLPAKPEAAYFIETLARKYFYQNLQEDSLVKSAYGKYLNGLLVSPFNAVSGHAAFQLCKIWDADAEKYNTTLSSHIIRYGSSLPAFDSNYRLYYNKTLQLLDRFETKLDSFSYLKMELCRMKDEILKPGVKIRTRDVQTPDSAFPALLQYRNITNLYTRIIRISPWDNMQHGKSFNLTRFMKMPALSEKNQALSLPADHQWHNAFLKFGPLPAGRYIILYSDTVFSGNITRVDFIDLSVTNIAVINNDSRVFVLNRVTGLPLKGATVLGIAKKGNIAGGKSVVNELGYVLFKENTIDSVAVYAAGDSLLAPVNNSEENIPNELYNKNNYEDLTSFYEENIRLNIFTDRAIYRPGQAVFFKGIFTVPDPKTGELRVLDFQKLRFPFFENLVYKTILKFKKLKTIVTISDPFNRKVDTFRVTPNKFGSFSGSFTIPKEAATGEWNFETDDYRMEDQNSGRFRVEEYKRPGFKLSLTKPKTELQLGDSFGIRIKVRSFAGAPLSHVLLRYHVYRYATGIGEKEIMRGESFSNELGEYQLLVGDSLLPGTKIPGETKTNIEYKINVEALDETGESHEQDLSVSLSNRPVNINLPVPEMVDRNQIAPFFISMTNEFSGPVNKSLDIRIYKSSAGRQTESENSWPPPDLWNENRDAWQRSFPDVKFDGSSGPKPVRELIYKTTLPAETEKKFKMPVELLATGSYEMETVCHAGGKIQGESSRFFSVYDSKENSFPGNDFEWLPVNSLFVGDTVKLISGFKSKNYFSVYHFAYRVKRKNGVSAKYDYIIRVDKKGLNEMNYKIPQDITGDLTLTHLFIMDNRIYKREHRIRVLNIKSPDPDIIVEKYRTQISPGQKETFIVTIKTKNTREAAELMTTMYDASLEELEPHIWAIPRDHIYYNSGNNWQRDITAFQTNSLYETETAVDMNLRGDHPLWWISSADLLAGYFMDQFVPSDIDPDGSRMLYGRLNGLSTQNYGLADQIVVTGYGTSKRALTGAVTTVTIRGIKSLSGYNQPMIILDGVLFTGDINKINPESITQGIVLKGADAVTLYGSRAADGVLVLSTHGPVVLPQISEAPLPPLVIRKNFSESAFFYPTIYAGKDGMYSISFTLPESVTEWKWKLFAHTRSARFAYLEKSLFSQLPLMVQPSMPRFLYQGDQIDIRTRITNLDSVDVTGRLTCLIEDLVTGENLTASLLKESGQTFNVKRGSNTAGSFLLRVPPGLLHPLRIRISGSTKTYSDGEEHIIPVLSGKFLLSQTKFITPGASQSVELTTPPLPDDAEPYGASLFISSKPQAALMNALTFLAFDPYGCSEQTLNKMLAFAMAIHLAGSDSLLRHDLSKIPDTASAGPGEKEDPEQREEQMPWLKLRHAGAIQQQKLRQLFDTTSSGEAFEKKLNELMAMQNGDGGLSWFKGGVTDDFISGYVLVGLGKMQMDNLLDPRHIKLNDGYQEFLSRLIEYIDRKVAAKNKWTDPVHFLYARSYWLKDYPMADSVRHAADTVLKRYWNHVSSYDLDMQATLIIISLRFTDEGGVFHDRSLKQLESIRQLAITDSSNGVRWKEVSNADDLDRQTEETVARIAEAFQTVGSSDEPIRGIVKWILKMRNEHEWSTTKSTAAVVGLLQTSDLPGVTNQLSAKSGDNVLKVTDNLFQGRTTDFLDLSGKKFPSTFLINMGNAGPVSGGIKYYYFDSKPPEDSLNQVVKVRKSLSRLDDSTKTWVPVSGNTVLHIGDKLKTELTISTSKQINYVFINERRAAAMEPRESESGYKYEGDLRYYLSVKDAGYLIFIDKIPSGIHHISYETVVSASGSFTNGPSSLQCMYQPSINTFSNTQNITVNQ